MRTILSVLVTTYNQAQFIEECLESILSQEVDFNFEIIIYDSASSDDTALIARSILDKKSISSKVIVDRSNRYARGCAYMLDALANCQGEYIAFIDGDDLWLDRQKLFKQMNFLKENREVDVVGSRAEIWSQEKREVVNIIPSKERIGVSPGRDLAWENFLVNSSVLIRNSIDKLDKNSYSLSLYKDYALWAQLSRDSFVSVLPEVMTRYRIDTGQNISQTNSNSFRKGKDLHDRALLSMTNDASLSHYWLSAAFDDLFLYLSGLNHKPIDSKILRQIKENEARLNLLIKENDELRSALKTMSQDSD